MPVGAVVAAAAEVEVEDSYIPVVVVTELEVAIAAEDSCNPVVVEAEFAGKDNYNQLVVEVGIVVEYSCIQFAFVVLFVAAVDCSYNQVVVAEVVFAIVDSCYQVVVVAVVGSCNQTAVVVAVM